ncbi:MAG: ABC transporter permease [Candidatus Fimivivens sp.]|nr:ABC transporter permease [Candidatus Fimivivens sp.]
MNSIKQFWSDFCKYRFLLISLTGKDFKLKYRRSVLGVVWSVLNPLLMNAVMVAVFSKIIPMDNIQNFPVYLIIGQLLFGFFNEATSMAMVSILSSAALIRKVYIPKYMFPLEKTCFSLINCLLSFIALVIVMAITGSPVYMTAILALYPIITLFFFSLGIGMILSTMTVFFRDMIHLWSVFTTALMYLSAIFYDGYSITGLPGIAIRLNPIFWYIQSFRQVVLYGKQLTLSMVLWCTLSAIASVVIGAAAFNSQQDKFVIYV